ncbi:hypothetical protein ACFQV2_10655 [Actinokineospora soli]|uniref:Secreted protein n=1 Tax=Actinokineospora soli TaxID=1048753 RepID=A0ABW2TL19_9PSEU
MRALRLVLALVLVLAGALVWAQPAAGQPAAGSGKEVEVVTGPFTGLKIRVSQTKDLINQTIRVEWEGVRATGPQGRFASHYLQIMQCWGDEIAPKREQCQFGALQSLSGSVGLGNWTASRQVAYASPEDKAETIPRPANGVAYVPFDPVDGEPTTATGAYFDSSTSNEVPFAKTLATGRGQIDFEVQTAVEANGLGCGVVQPGTGKPRHCFLVVVPRGGTEVDGKEVAETGDAPRHLNSSPLSASNWVNAIPIRLDFRPVGRACPIGEREIPLSGNELVADAVARWQPALCAEGPTFGYAQVPDLIARDMVTADPEPGMVFVTDPVPPAEVTRPLVYAPVAISGLAVAFVFERQSRGPVVEPEEVWQRDGELVEDINLTPRLVAKLLTQSYRDVVPGNQEYLRKNPRRLNEDPDFLTINEDLVKHTALMNALDAMAPSVDMDVTAALWRWIDADPEARAFLDGTPDPWGMVVNKNYTGMRLPVTNFPRSDTTCHRAPFQTAPEQCALLAHPLAADLHEGARAISRGDTLGREEDPDAVVKPSYKRIPRQPVGQRSLLAIVDTPSALRYGLPMASLRNASGEFVPPSPDSLYAALEQTAPAPGTPVLSPDPAKLTGEAYPLPAITYAVAAPSTLGPDAPAYASLLAYAVGPGQRLGDGAGQLPLGYVPLPDDLREQALGAAQALLKGEPVPTPRPTDATPDPTEDPGTPGDDDPAPTSDAPDPAGQPVPAKPTKTTTPTPTPVAESWTTPSTPVSWWLRHLLAAVLVGGGLATAAGPVLRRFAGR